MSDELEGRHVLAHVGDGSGFEDPIRVAASEQPRLPRYRYETVKRPARGASLHHLDTSFYQISTSIPRLARTARVSDTVLYQPLLSPVRKGWYSDQCTKSAREVRRGV